jgi:subtilisin
MALRIASATVVLALFSTFAYAQPQQQRLIVGVTDVGRAERELPAQAQVHLKLGLSRAFAVTGDPERLRHLAFVRYVEPDPVDAVHIVQTTELQYGVNNIDAEVVWGGSQGATTVFPAGAGGFGARVAVLDTGVDCLHEDLAGACGPGANFVSFFEPADDHGHGTHVAGIIAARANGVGTIGVAPEATVLPVKVMNAQGSGAWSWVAAGIDWAVDNGAHVISMSLSGNPGSQAVADAVAEAQARGVLVVSAAGNSGCCNTVGYPALYPGSMAVGAVDMNDMIASFSSTGPAIDVTAPGVAVKAPVPIGACALCHPSGYMLLNGTSMATPHVSGVAALLMTRGFTAAQAWNAMTSTARDLGAAAHDPIYGYGRVDALAAVNSTPSEPPPPPPTDDVAPSVVITSPQFLQRVQQNSFNTIHASASDNVGVQRVEFYVDLVGKCVDTTAPYTCTWVVPRGKGLYYLIEAYAFDAAGNYASHYTIVYTR